MTLGLPILEKAKDYSRLTPEKIRRADGHEATYWVAPEDRNEGKLAGQKALFEDRDAGGPAESGDRGYHDHLDRSAEDYQIKPLVGHVSAYDPELARRIESKYKNYQFDRDTKEKDIEVDYQTAWYLKMMKNHPEKADEYKDEYHEKTDKIVAMLNKRKTAMLKLKPGSKVRVGKQVGIVAGFSKRGFPVVHAAGTSRPMFYEELAV